MLLLRVLLLCCSAALAAKYNRTIKQPPNSEKLAGGTFAIGAIPYYAYVTYYDYDNSQYYVLGNGVVVAHFYVLTSALIYDPVQNTSPYGITVTAGALLPEDENHEGEVKFGRDVIFHPDCDPSSATSAMKHCIALLKVCPGFSTDAIAPGLASDLSPYRDPSLAVTMFQYVEQDDSSVPLVFADRYIGEFCECNVVAGFDVAYHICLGYDDAVYSNTWDRESGAMVTNYDGDEVIGLLVKEDIDDGNGEVVLAYKPYLPWIADNTFVAPTVY